MHTHTQKQYKKAINIILAAHNHTATEIHVQSIKYFISNAIKILDCTKKSLVFWTSENVFLTKFYPNN